MHGIGLDIPNISVSVPKLLINIAGVCAKHSTHYFDLTNGAIKLMKNQVMGIWCSLALLISAHISLITINDHMCSAFHALLKPLAIIIKGE